MYEGFYEKSSGYAMAAGMLLNTMSLLHANDNSVQADEGGKRHNVGTVAFRVL